MNYSIGQVAKELDVSIHTLRYYEKEGLTLPIHRDEHQNRVYSNSDIQWFYMIRCLRDTGMPIRDIKQYIELFKQGKKTISVRKEVLIKYQEHIEKQMKLFEKTKLLLTKKIEYYGHMENDSNNIHGSISDNCYDYFTEWEEFKQILKENIHE